MENHKHGDEHIAAEATEWHLQFRDNAGCAVDRAAFAEWLTRSPVHVEEFLEISALWSNLGKVETSQYDMAGLIAAARAERAHDKVVRLAPLHHAAAGSRAPAPRSRAWRFSVGIAASLLLGLALWCGLMLTRRGTEYSTAIGEQRSISLSDGSVIFLNTNSEVRVQLTKTGRNIELLRGEARFQVARSPQRPFVVATGDATIRALGTVFNVAMSLDGTQVAVIEGRVELRERDVTLASVPDTVPESSLVGAVVDPKKRQAKIELAAGQRAAVTNRGILSDVGPSIESVNAWTERRLVFRDKTLAEVVGQFNRYRQQPLVIDDPRLAGLRVSGTFDPSDPDSLLTYLGAVEAVQVRALADGSVHLSHGHE